MPRGQADLSLHHHPALSHYLFGEIFFWLGVVGFGYFVCRESLEGIFKFLLLYFLVPRVVGVAVFYAGLRWPKFFESLGRLYKNPVVTAAAIVVGLSVWLIFAGAGTHPFSFRPDWVGALFVLAFGGASVIAVWPPYWVFHRFIQPWAVRTNSGFKGFVAIAFIALLYWGAWMTGLIIWVSRG